MDMTVETAGGDGLPATRSPAGWVRRRMLLAGLWLLVVIAVAPIAQRPASLSALYEAAENGRLGTVRLTEGLPPGATGYVTQHVVWRDAWWVLRRTSVVVVSPGERPPAELSEPRARTTDDVAAQLRQRDRRVRLASMDREPSSFSVHGWTLPGWVGPALIVHTLLTLFVLVNGPEPWRATRWAWFWLLTPPIGTMVFLVLSGPTPGLPRPRGRGRRLTGGWAFLLALVIGGALPSS
jgi:hypothetical protein